MLLTEHSICHYLLGKGLIDIAAVVAGDFSVRSRKSRNNNFIVNREFSSSSYFIKQADGFDADKIDSISREAAFYQQISSSPSLQPLAGCVPAYVLFDPVHFILVTKLIPGAVSLQQLDYGKKENSHIAAGAAGRLLSVAHQCKIDDRMIGNAGFLNSSLPWVFTIIDTGNSYLHSAASPAAKQAMGLILNNREFLLLMEAVVKDWQDNGLLHGDCKLNNFLQQKDLSVKLIDWELAAYGDTCFDVAGLMQSWLLQWLIDEVMPAEMKKGIDSGETQQQLNIFWQAYAGNMNYKGSEAKRQLNKCTRFTAMKLIHACFEMTHDEESLSPLCARLLQTAFNILKSPEEAAVKLLGIIQE